MEKWFLGERNQYNQQTVQMDNDDNLIGVWAFNTYKSYHKPGLEIS